MAKRMKTAALVLAAAALLLLSVAAGRAQDRAIPTPQGAARVAAEGQPTGQIAEAAHGAAEAENLNPVTVHPSELILTILIFVALLVLLRATAWKPILNGLQNREKAIREGVEAAARARADAERTTRELEQKLAEAQAAAAKQIQQAKADALKLAEGIRSQAEAEATALKDRAMRDIAAAKQQAVAQINTHAAELATTVARKILQRNITADDQDRLVSQSLEEIGKNGRALAGAR